MYKYTTYTFCALVFFLDIGQKLCFFYLRKKGKAEVMIIRHVSNERKENVLLISEDLDSRGKSKWLEKKRRNRSYFICLHWISNANRTVIRKCV